MGVYVQSHENVGVLQVVACLHVPDVLGQVDFHRVHYFLVVTRGLGVLVYIVEDEKVGVDDEGMGFHVDQLVNGGVRARVDVTRRGSRVDNMIHLVW